MHDLQKLEILKSVHSSLLHSHSLHLRLSMEYVQNDFCSRYTALKFYWLRVLTFFPNFDSTIFLFCPKIQQSFIMTPYRIIECFRVVILQLCFFNNFITQRIHSYYISLLSPFFLKRVQVKKVFIYLLLILLVSRLPKVLGLFDKYVLIIFKLF